MLLIKTGKLWPRCRRKLLCLHCQILLHFALQCFLCYCAAANFVHTESIDAFNDNIAFKMKWAGYLWNLNPTDKETSLMMTTENLEKYVCIIPKIETTHDENTKQYKGPTAAALLKPLFSKVTCTYRLEPFWTYELCHGHHLRQYHEESTLQGMHVQEYILGRFDSDKYSELEIADNEQIILTKQLDDKEKPYIELVMGDGSVCDLHGRPRMTRVLYFCDENAHNELHSLKETPSCEYEVVVLTPLLCLHPMYRDKGKHVNGIKCHAVDKSPTIPSKLLQLEREEKEYEISQQEDSNNAEQVLLGSAIPLPPPAPKAEKKSFPHDPKLVDDFLSGTYCLQGGSGWWKYDFCFGKKVEQYHEEYRQPRIVILLGTWNKDVHISWIKANPQKKPTSKQVSHFYASGAVCDVTGEARQVEVKLRCILSSSRTNAVSMFLLEPKTCKYTLTVETPIVCPLLETVDEYGLFRKNE